MPGAVRQRRFPGGGELRAFPAKAIAGTPRHPRLPRRLDDAGAVGERGDEIPLALRRPAVTARLAQDWEPLKSGGIVAVRVERGAGGIGGDEGVWRLAVGIGGVAHRGA